MGKMGLGPRKNQAPSSEDLQTRVEGERSQCHQHRGGSQQRKFPLKVFAAVLEFSRERAVHGRRATAGGGEHRSLKPQAVAGVTRIGPVGQAHGVKGTEEKVARFVPGEEAAGTVSAMRCWGKPNDQRASPWISKRRKGPCPVGLAPEPPRRGSRGLSTPGN